MTLNFRRHPVRRLGVDKPTYILRKRWTAATRRGFLFLVRCNGPQTTSEPIAQTPLPTATNTRAGDGPIWFRYLASGDWLGAFMTMEESFELQGPFDSLLAALFVRAYYLPRNVWTERKEVTWAQALACLPVFLARRLGDEAVDYLHAFPVFRDETNAQGVTENSVRAAPFQPRPNPGSDSISEPVASGSGEASEGGKETETETSETDLEEGSAATSTVPGAQDKPARKRRKDNK
ncbi:hypothetical protein MTO96_009078 [Rhipicephalus appendiculatus]